MSPKVKATLTLLAIPAGVFAGLFLWFLIFPDNTPPHERIAKECQREFGFRGEQAVTDCRIRLMTRYLLEAERNKLDSAYSRSR